jgi:hypothetical protein
MIMESPTPACLVLPFFFALLAIPLPASAFPALKFHLEAGFGGSTVSGSAAGGGTLGAGLSTPLAHAGVLAVEFSASSGSGKANEIGFPRGARSLTTFLLGFQAVEMDKMRGPFAFLGLGIGHVTLTGAFEEDTSTPKPIPDQNDTGLAIGLQAGYRFSGVPGPFSWGLGAALS